MADEIRVRVLGREREYLKGIGRYLNYGDTDSEIIRTLLREKAEELESKQQPPLVRIGQLMRQIQRILDAEAERQPDADGK